MPDIQQIRHPGLARGIWQRLSIAALALVGWHVEGELPETPKFIILVYPHTSNWDVVFGMLSGYALGLLSRWPYGYMVKDAAMRWPVVGRWLRRQGALAIDRSRTSSVVDQMAEAFAEHDRLMVAITPEGTRSHTPYWKSGFYYIALKANIPVQLAYLDYRRKVGGLGPLIWLTGQVEADLDRMRAFYADIVGHTPHLAGDIRFKPSDDATTS